MNSLNSTSETPFLGDFCHANSALATKATACLNTIQWAKDTGHMNLRILTDSYRLVHLLATTDTKDITLKWTLTKIRTLGMVFQTCQVLRVSRDQITRATQLARWCQRSRIGFNTSLSL